MLQHQMGPLAQCYTRRGVRNMLPPGTAPKDDRATRQAVNHLSQSALMKYSAGTCTRSIATGYVHKYLYSCYIKRVYYEFPVHMMIEHPLRWVVVFPALPKQLLSRHGQTTQEEIASTNTTSAPSSSTSSMIKFLCSIVLNKKLFSEI